MSLYLTKSLSIPLGKAGDREYIARRLCRLLRVPIKDIVSCSPHKRSVDARSKRDVHFVCSYVVDCSSRPQNAVPFSYPQDVLDNARRKHTSARCIVIGAGPAGLFAALYLSKCGLGVTVVERGFDVGSRKQAVDEFFSGGRFNEKSNVQFGLGGAGTFSDGKLTSNLGATDLGRTVFNRFVGLGAPREILFDSLPHIGTDKLQSVIANLRDEIISFGGNFIFESQAVDLVLDGDKVIGAVIEQDGKTFELLADYVILACGHSARDTFQMLYKRGADMQFKPFAVGLRIEHPREFINTAQYGELFAAHRDLDAASYKLTHKCVDGHGCYSFCMCPGGIVVAANSEPQSVVVNGMSNFDRAADNSNSALVVTVNADDVERYGYGRDVFSGVRFQQDLERKAYLMGGGNYVAPYQNAADFVENRESFQPVTPSSYPRGTKSLNLRCLLPDDLCGNLAEALIAFDRRINGFLTLGTLVGVETRTSSPVKIIRGDDFQSNIKRLYPAGEGAGYAGGIVSSAVDGLRVAVTIAESI